MIRTKQWVALALLAMSGAAYGDSGSRPMGGTCHTQFTMTGPTTVALTGTCHLRHLGLVTVAATQALTWYPDGTVGILHGTVYTAANGDQLHATVDGLGVPLSPFEMALSGTETYEGGTGRFANASGVASIVGVARFTGPAGGIGAFTSEGTIGY